MDTTIAALFDLDGVIIDTEPQYSIFGIKPEPNIYTTPTISA